MASLHWVDYALFAAFVAVSLGIGLYHALIGKGQATTQTFIMANRNLRVGPTAISLLASYVSAIAVLGMPAETFMFGTELWLGFTISFSCALLAVERVAIPWLYPLNLTSVFQVLYMGIAMYAPSAALEEFVPSSGLMFSSSP
ncbi:hypothetical protein NP493_86g04013 [Ridgeia piscesae]|uniref:Sodium-dependent multivitamin transporter n=1 Tax=Ridgeia piscesae TaxID=27915 RepID=A0AAD9UHY3_RIDPI|nr:hypothetical protein NP493_86g04013 [Ridgeia piscesae]